MPRETARNGIGEVSGENRSASSGGFSMPNQFCMRTVGVSEKYPPNSRPMTIHDTPHMANIVNIFFMFPRGFIRCRARRQTVLIRRPYPTSASISPNIMM